ncbi:MFS transporter [[Clostridium] aminophilum]|uniref:MFS transporter n=1 Tax=[Clostridium] aminophilum TaxID=1526 RepID=UPI003F9EA649
MENNKQHGFGILLPITLLAYFLILMDNSIVFTSSVEIGEGMHLNAGALAWVSNAYTLTFGGFLLLSGRLSDLLGRKRIFQIGLALFGLMSLMVGVSQNAFEIIAARAVQGIGSSIIAPTTLALMMDAYTGEQRTRAISYYGATAGIGSSLGLLIGGALTSLISWRAGFLINVPLTIILIVLTQKYIRDYEGERKKIDFVGSILSVLGFASLIYGFGADTNQLLFILTGVFLLLVFIFYEKRQSIPILPLELFHNRIRSGAYAVRLIFMMAILPYWFLLPQVMQRLYGFSALQAGIAFLPLSVTTFLSALQLPRLTKMMGNNRVLLIGDLVLIVGFVWSFFADLNRGYFAAVLLPLILIGFGSALVTAPVTSAGIYEAPDEIAGSASGLTNAMHQLGGPIGLSIIMAQTSDFHYQTAWMVGFSVISTIIVYIFIYQNGRKPALD